jgi:phosphodiesterase/alkaline phosphatase D-like protein
MKSFSSVLLLTLLLLLLFTKVHTQTNDHLLLVVGDVTQNYARVLYESLLDEIPLNHMLKVSLVRKQEPSNIIKTVSISAINKPQVLVLDSLAENTEYMAVFESEKYKTNSTVTFTTLSSSNDVTRDYKILVVSCDRYYEDEDDEMWKQILRDEPDRFGMVHLGDQIYADRVVKEIIQWKKQLVSPPFADLVEKFRQVYRKTWGNPVTQQILRHGAHWMIPDDHDILNNLDKRFIELNAKGENHSDIIYAGREAFYEYQYQLVSDLHMLSNDSQPVITNEVKEDKIFFSKTFANVCFLFLDFRFQRTFQYDPRAPFIGTKQFQWLEEELYSCGAQSRLTIIFSSTPVLFLGKFMARLVYFAEKERYSNHPDLLPDTIKLLDMIGEFKMHYPNKDVKLIGGDIHQFFISRICNVSAVPICIDQMVTSGVTKGSTVIHELKLLVFYTFNRYFQKATAGTWELERQVNQPGMPLQQYLGTNYGIINIHPTAATNKEFFTWKGVSKKNETFWEHVTMQIYDSMPAIKPLLILLITGILMLTITLCINRFSSRRRTGSTTVPARQQ